MAVSDSVAFVDCTMNYNATNQTHYSLFTDIVMLFEGTLVIVFNAAALVIFASNVNLKKRSTILLRSVAVADLVAGVSVIWNVTATLCASNGTETTVMWFLRKCTWYIGQPSSINGLVFIAMERAYATLYPLRHLTSSKRMYFVAISLQWLLVAPLAISSVSLPLLGNSPNDDLATVKKIKEISALVIIVTSYTLIFVKVKQQNRKLESKYLPRTQQREHELAKTLFIVTGLSLITWLPDIVLHMVSSSYPDNGIHALTLALRIANSFINPIVYFLRMKEFRQTAMKALRTLHRNSRERNEMQDTRL